jgi:2-octaprenyl-6-methoxyphenol hydroxylase
MGTETVVDIVIAGGGAVGLSLAVALRQARGGALAVAVCDPALARRGRDDRAFAIAAGPRRMLQALGAWHAAEATAEPILAMRITDSRVGDPVRPVFLTFDGEVGEGEPFAHMVEHAALLDGLHGRAAACGVALRPVGVVSAERDAEGAVVRLSDGSVTEARLVVACDGGRSALREAAGIDTVEWPYGQSGIVATIAHQRDHEGIAREHFLPSGPFAILPLRGRRSSIVWTERTRDVPAILGLDDEDLLVEIERRFGLELGALSMESRPAAYPLRYSIARRFVADRLALLGDAAHSMHPIAGQGLNMGLRDVAALAEAVVDTSALGLDPGSPDTLSAYECSRRFDTVRMGVVTDVLNRLFSNDVGPVRMLRDTGLSLVDRLPRLKGAFIREAAGIPARGPRLLRGEAL